MKTIKFLSMAALALVGAVMTGCSSDDNIIDTPQQPANNGKTVTLTMTVGLNGGETRALAADGTKTFAAGETMAVIYKNNSDETAMAETVALKDGDITNSGKSATFTVTLEDPDKTQNVTYVYPAAMVNSDGSVKDDALAEQDGTLASLGSNLDYCTNSGAWDNGALPELTLDNQFAILAITLKDTDGSNDITDTFDGLTIEDGTNTYNVTRTKDAGPIYVAIRPTTTADIEVNAYDGAVFYPKSLTGKTYAAGEGYNVSWRMTRGGIDLSRVPVPQNWSDPAVALTALDGDIIKGTLGSSKCEVSIASGASVTLNNATIDRYMSSESAGLTCLGNATINLVGTNTMDPHNGPGIFVPSGSTLTIDGSGQLTANGGNQGAGIGASIDATCGNITINGGTVIATGDDNAAGIGSGFQSSCGNITINGGTVTATTTNGSGIGSGNGNLGGVCGDITINGGTVNATGDYGAGIGSGYQGGCGSISITGGNVTATGGQGSAGIGSGQYQATCTSISITGGTVNATGGGYGGAGIGSGNASSCAGGVTITTDVTSVTATAGTPSYNQPNPNSIGAGNFGTCGTVTIGGVVYPDGISGDSPYTYTAPTSTTVTWNSSNVSDLRVWGPYDWDSYTKEGITLKGNAENVNAEWADYGDGPGINFNMGASGGYTFTAPKGKKFTKIEMTIYSYDGWYTAAYNDKLGSGWPSGEDAATTVNSTKKVTWTGDATSTVDLLTDSGLVSFGGATVSSIEFTLE
jgi:hypothetical protein